MTLAVYMEARGEPVESQIAVATVTLNRTKEKDRPNTICGVVNQKGQYTWNKRVKIKEPKAFKNAKRISYLVLTGKIKSKVGSRTYFNNRSLGKKYKTPYKPIKINKLIFY